MTTEKNFDFKTTEKNLWNFWQEKKWFEGKRLSLSHKIVPPSSCRAQLGISGLNINDFVEAK